MRYRNIEESKSQPPMKEEPVQNNTTTLFVEIKTHLPPDVITISPSVELGDSKVEDAKLFDISFNQEFQKAFSYKSNSQSLAKNAEEPVLQSTSNFQN